jgi:hypothetical protein
MIEARAVEGKRLLAGLSSTGSNAMTPPRTDAFVRSGRACHSAWMAMTRSCWLRSGRLGGGEVGADSRLSERARHPRARHNEPTPARRRIQIGRDRFDRGHVDLQHVRHHGEAGAVARFEQMK